MMTKININLFALIFAVATLTSCEMGKPEHSSVMEAGTFKVAILYPNGEGATFDMDYYEEKHMPMVAGFLGKNLKCYEVDKGVSGRTPNDEAPYVAIGYFFINDVAEYNNSIAQNRDAVISDFEHYTNIQPVVQISEIKRVNFNLPED